MKKLIYGILVISAIVLISAVVLVLVMGPQNIMARVMGAAAPPPDQLDTSTTRRSDQGFFQVTYSSSNEPILINEIQSWTVHIETADGQPLEQADIQIEGGMPEHGHGLPTQPRMTNSLGEGNYTVEGLKFNMPGWWEVTFHITANGKSDTVTFNLILK